MKILNHTARGFIPTATRRDVLKLVGCVLTTTITPASARRQSGAAQGVRRGLIEALEQHGSCARSLSWAHDLHESMGAREICASRYTASGDNSVETATRLALSWFDLAAKPPDGAVVVVCSASGPECLRGAHTAYRLVRHRLPIAAYCAYSHLERGMPRDSVTVHVALGWY